MTKKPRGRPKLPSSRTARITIRTYPEIAFEARFLGNAQIEEMIRQRYDEITMQMRAYDSSASTPPGLAPVRNPDT